MKDIIKQLAATAALAFFCAGIPASLASAQQTAPDNSQHNKNQSQNADNQSNSAADRMTTAKVRKAIIADKRLSTYAHNVKIITLDGQVTLKGPVKSEEEKQQVASDVSTVISPDNFTNQLTVKQ